MRGDSAGTITNSWIAWCQAVWIAFPGKGAAEQSDHCLAEPAGVAGISFVRHGGQGYGEGRTLGAAGFHLDRALVFVDDFLCHRQAEACSLLAL